MEREAGKKTTGRKRREGKRNGMKPEQGRMGTQRDAVLVSTLPPGWLDTS